MPNHLTAVAIAFLHLFVALPAAGFTDAPLGICDRAARQAAQREGVPLNVLRAITRVETGRTRSGQLEPWPWTINVRGKGYWFASEAEAKTYVFNIFKAGERSFDIGCFQVNYHWHGRAFSSIEEMFDPGANAAYAARFLNQLYTELGNWTAAVGAYHSRTRELAHAYTVRYKTVLAQLDDGVGAPATGQLIPLGPATAGTGAMGSLVPVGDAATAFIAFN